MSVTAINNKNSLIAGIRLSNNTRLTNIDELRNVERQPQSSLSINIINNPKLTNLKAFSHFTTIDYLTIIDSPQTDLKAFANLASLHGLTIKNNQSLTSLDGLANVVSINTQLEIGGNPALTNIVGLNKLSSVGGDLIINNNNSLIGLKGLETLSSVYASLTITDNDKLISMKGLDNLTSVRFLEIQAWLVSMVFNGFRQWIVFELSKIAVYAHILPSNYPNAYFPKAVPKEPLKFLQIKYVQRQDDRCPFSMTKPT